MENVTGQLNQVLWKTDTEVASTLGLQLCGLIGTSVPGSLLVGSDRATQCGRGRDDHC
jgi:hypothetical protein